MSTLVSRPGLPNPLNAAPEADQPAPNSKQQPDSGPREGHGVLTELSTTTKGRKPEPPASGSSSTGNRPGPLVLAVHASTEIDFAPDICHATEDWGWPHQ